MSVLAAKNVEYVYQSKYQKVQALKGISCDFEEGKFYAIVGASGSGKTTLLSMLAALGTPTAGEVTVDGKNVCEIGAERHRRENVTVIYQAFNLFPALTVLENVMYPMGAMGKLKREQQKRAKQLLQSVGLGEMEYKKFPAMLSGGQQQRVAIARALASSAKIILADEPTGNLDSENSQIVIDLLKDLVKKQNYCVVVVTHDMNIAAQANTIYCMKDGLLFRSVK